jgi:tetratricopeptide (TPR) repeat protein
MVRSKSVVAMVLLGVLLGSGSLAAQKPSYSSRGDKALQALDWDVLWGRKPGDWAQTIAAFESATRGGNGKDWCTDAFFLGFAYYTSGRLPEAIAAFDDLFNSADKLNCDTQGLLPAWHHYRGKAYNKSGQYKEAAASFAKALNLAPKERPADFWPKWWFRGILPTKEVCYSWLASAQSESGAYQESAGSYKKEIELNPTDGGPYSGLADALIHLKQYDDALAAAKRGIELKPNWYA